MSVHLEVARPTAARERAAEQALALAHLIACLEGGADLLHEVGRDVDAKVVRAHVAQLRRGHEWPGDAITPPVLA